MKKHLVWLNIVLITLWIVFAGNYTLGENRPGSEYDFTVYLWLGLIFFFLLLGGIYYWLVAKSDWLPNRGLKLLADLCLYFTAIFPLLILTGLVRKLLRFIDTYLESNHDIYGFDRYFYFPYRLFAYVQVLAIILLVIASYYQRRREVK